MKHLLLLISSLFILQFTYAQHPVGIDSLMFSPHWYGNVDNARNNSQNVWYLDLNLQKNRQFPSEICEMISLKRLDLSFNYFTSIPDCIGNLQQLEWLDLSGTYYLNTINPAIGKLYKLRELNIKDNRLSKGEIEKLKKLLPHTIIND